MGTKWIDSFVHRGVTSSESHSKNNPEKRSNISAGAPGYTLAEVEEQIRKRHEKALIPPNKK